MNLEQKIVIICNLAYLSSDINLNEQIMMSNCKISSLKATSGEQTSANQKPAPGLLHFDAKEHLGPQSLAGLGLTSSSRYYVSHQYSALPPLGHQSYPHPGFC